MHILLLICCQLSEGRGKMGKEGERDRKGWEVNCHAQLKQGRRLAMAGPTLIVLE